MRRSLLLAAFLASAVAGCARQAPEPPPVLVAKELPKTTFELDEPEADPEKARQKRKADIVAARRAAVDGRIHFDDEDDVPKVIEDPQKPPPPSVIAKPVAPEKPAAEVVRKAKTGPLKIWEIGVEIPSYFNRGVLLTLTKVELYRGDRSRWHFTLMNHAGTDRTFDLSLRNSYLADTNGNRYAALGDSLGTHPKGQFEHVIQDGLKFSYWIEWPAPIAGARSFTVSMINREGFSQGARFNKFTVQLPEDEPEDTEEGTPKSNASDDEAPVVVKAKKKGQRAAAPAPKFAPVTEAFANVENGELPEGWKSEKANLAVKKTGTRAGLMLINPAIRDQVTVPVEPIGERFHLECEFEMTDPDSKILIRLEGADTLTLGVGGGQFLLQDEPKKSLSYLLKLDGGKNLLTLDRTVGYVAKVNGTIITFPITVAPRGFDKLSITLQSSAVKNAKSPVIRSIRITP